MYGMASAVYPSDHKTTRNRIVHARSKPRLTPLQGFTVQCSAVNAHICEQYWAWAGLHVVGEHDCACANLQLL